MKSSTSMAEIQRMFSRKETKCKNCIRNTSNYVELFPEFFSKKAGCPCYLQNTLLPDQRFKVRCAIRDISFSKNELNSFKLSSQRPSNACALTSPIFSLRNFANFATWPDSSAAMLALLKSFSINLIQLTWFFLEYQ